MKPSRERIDKWRRRRVAMLVQKVRDQWASEEGDPIDPDDATWLDSVIRSHYAPVAPLPNVFLSPDGDVEFSWKIGTRHATLNIDPKRKTGYWHVLDLETNKGSDSDLDLNEVSEWERFGLLFEYTKRNA